MPIKGATHSAIYLLKNQIHGLLQKRGKKEKKREVWQIFEYLTNTTKIQKGKKYINFTGPIYKLSNPIYRIRIRHWQRL
jgi:hypothetical protein